MQEPNGKLPKPCTTHQPPALTPARQGKEAMLNEPDAVRGIAGISIVSGVEDFIVVPFEAQAEVQ